MIFLPEHPILPTIFPIDLAVIRTRIRLKDEVGKCRENDLDSLPPDLRPLVHHITPDSKQDNASTSSPGGPRKKYNPTIATREIYVKGFKGIKLHAIDDPLEGWTIHTITLNPGSVCHSHNGRLIEVEHFVHAGSALIQVVTPLLANQDDWIHIMPGLHEGSRASWHKIEIPFHVLDADGKILRAFANAKHPEINKPPLYLRNGESIAFENSKGSLLIRVYRKDLEMRKKLRKDVTNDQPVLRIEVVLSGDKLRAYLASGSWQDIDGKEHLVSFRACDLRAALVEIMSKFQGVYTKAAGEKRRHDQKLGRHMAWVSLVTGLSLDEQIAHQVERHHAHNKQESIANTKCIHRTAAHDELALLSTVNISGLFHEGAWNYQPAVVCSKLEAMAEGGHWDVCNHPLVEAAYGIRFITQAPVQHELAFAAS